MAFTRFQGFIQNRFLHGLSLLVVLSVLASSCTIGTSKKNESDKPETGGGKPQVEKVAPELTCQNGKNNPKLENSPVVVMISIDGCRYDYPQKYKATNLLKIAKSGIAASSLRPSFPTSTFPNHISLITGRFPGHHGIVANVFYDKARKEYYKIGDPKSNNDGTWYEGEPLWAVAERSGLLSNVMFWVGSEAKISGIHPNCFAKYDGRVSNEDRVDQTIEWLKLPKSKRPHFIGLYFSVVDEVGHKHGPNSKEVEAAVLEVDKAIGRLNDFVEKQDYPINLVVVSDHGMENINKQEPIIVNNITPTEKFEIGERGAVMMMYSEDSSLVSRAYMDLKRAEKNFKVFLRKDLPAEFALGDSKRAGDLVIVGDPGYYIIDRTFVDAKPGEPLIRNNATHGWDYHYRNMHGIFMAKGPNVNGKGVSIDNLRNVDIYPFVLGILGISTSTPNDSDPSALNPYILH